MFNLMLDNGNYHYIIREMLKVFNIYIQNNIELDDEVKEELKEDVERFEEVITDIKALLEGSKED